MAENCEITLADTYVLLTHSNLPRVYSDLKEEFITGDQSLNVSGFEEIDLSYLYFRESIQSPLVRRLANVNDIAALIATGIIGRGRLKYVEAFGRGILTDGDTDYIHHVYKTVLENCPGVNLRGHTGAAWNLVQATVENAQQYWAMTPQNPELFGFNVYARIHKDPTENLRKIFANAEARGVDVSRHFRVGLEHILPIIQRLTNHDTSVEERASDLAVIKELYVFLAEKKIRSVSLPETTGRLSPDEAYASTMVNLMLMHESGMMSKNPSETLHVELHFHNDTFNTVANTRAAIRAIEEFKAQTGMQVRTRLTFGTVAERNGITTPLDVADMGLMDLEDARILTKLELESLGIDSLTDYRAITLALYMTGGTHANKVFDDGLDLVNTLDIPEQYRGLKVDEALTLANRDSVFKALFIQAINTINADNYGYYASQTGQSAAVWIGPTASGRLIQLDRLLRGKRIPNALRANAMMSRIKGKYVHDAMQPQPELVA